ncbi:hypothetical protein D9M68_1004640 [compost metagenome]
MAVGYPVREYPDRIQAALPLDDGFRHVVQHHQPFIAILDPGFLMPATDGRATRRRESIALPRTGERAAAWFSFPPAW